MREFLVWSLSAAVAFFLTAGAFLLLANLGSNASERNLAPRSSSEGRPLLEVALDRNRLSSLRPAEDQSLSFRVQNGSERDFSQVSVNIRVSSDNTAFGESRYYRAEINDLKAGQSERVRSSVDLSSFENSSRNPPEPGVDEGNRIILEVQASTPEGISSVKTAVLPL